MAASDKVAVNQIFISTKDSVEAAQKCRMVIMMNEPIQGIQPKCLYLGNRVTQDVDQTMITVGDAATLTVVDEDSVGIVLDYFFEMNRSNFSAEFTILTNRDDIFQGVFFQGDFHHMLGGR